MTHEKPYDSPALRQEDAQRPCDTGRNSDAVWAVRMAKVRHDVTSIWIRETTRRLEDTLPQLGDLGESRLASVAYPPLRRLPGRGRIHARLRSAIIGHYR